MPMSYVDDTIAASHPDHIKDALITLNNFNKRRHFIHDHFIPRLKIYSEKNIYQLLFATEYQKFEKTVILLNKHCGVE